MTDGGLVATDEIPAGEAGEMQRCDAGALGRWNDLVRTLVAHRLSARAPRRRHSVPRHSSNSACIWANVIPYASRLARITRSPAGSPSCN